MPLARVLGLGSIIGYLAAGIAIGPWGLKLVTDPQDMLHFAEFGVVLMLFLVGLELEPQPALGAAQADLRLGQRAAVRLGAAARARSRLACGVDWRVALVAALGLALSSTAIGLGVLGERNLLGTTVGPERAQRRAAAGRRGDPDPRAAAAARASPAPTRGGGGWLGAAKADRRDRR